MAKVIDAFAYLRTSSAANVGPDKDSDKRQRAAIAAFAKAHGYRIADEFYDAAISGADPIGERPGFEAMLKRLASNGVRTIIVETPDRFARDLAVQLAGHDMLKALGIALVPASAPDFFIEETPTAELVRQVLGAIAQFEKASAVARLAAARKRKREDSGKCEGRKSHAERRPETVRLAKRLHRLNRKTGARPSLRAISARLAAEGHLNEHRRPFAAKSVAAMLHERVRPPVESG
jgi:DNA invertase Pin-like site-specific DNA recombinase